MDDLVAGDPSHIGPYRLLGRLGAGGMGRVYLARSAGGRTVAVKLVQEQYANEPEFRQRFAREVAAARRVGGEWTAHVLDADVSASVPWVATSYVAGPSLQTVVDRDFGPLPERSLLVLANRLALALAAIHSAGLVHRDLKPANILLAVDGPRVIDFGITRALGALTGTGDLTRTGIVIGSPGFMSPEQVRGERVSAASDVFCLGAVLTFAATGRAPFGGLSEGHAAALLYRIAHDEPDLAGVPESLLPLVRACLHKDPARRPTPEQLAEATASDVPAHGWLPPALLAQLARRSGELLDVEGSPAPPPRRARAYRPPVPTPVASGRADPPPPPPPAYEGLPDKGPRRRVGVRIAVAVLAALLLGWFVVRPLVFGAFKSDDKGGGDAPTSSSAAFDFTGTWEGSFSGSGTLVRIVVPKDHQGGTARVDTLDGHQMCGGPTSVLSREGNTLKLNSLSGIPDQINSYGMGLSSSCPLLPTLTLSVDAATKGSVGLSMGDSVGSVERATDSGSSAVPDAFVGKWKRTQGAPEAESLYVTFTQGPIGKRLAHIERTQNGKLCTWNATLFKANTLQLTFAPIQLGASDPGSGCTDGYQPDFQLVGGTLREFFPGGQQADVKYTKTG